MGSGKIDGKMVAFWLPFLLSVIAGTALCISGRTGLGTVVYLAGTGISMLVAAAFCGR